MHEQCNVSTCRIGRFRQATLLSNLRSSSLETKHREQMVSYESRPFERNGSDSKRFVLLARSHHLKHSSPSGRFSADSKTSTILQEARREKTARGKRRGGDEEARGPEHVALRLANCRTRGTRDWAQPPGFPTFAGNSLFTDVITKLTGSFLDHVITT